MPSGARGHWRLVSDIGRVGTPYAAGDVGNGFVGDDVGSAAPDQRLQPGEWSWAAARVTDVGNARGRVGLRAVEFANGLLVVG